MWKKDETTFVENTDIRYKDFWGILLGIARRIHAFDAWLFSHKPQPQPKKETQVIHVYHHQVKERENPYKKSYEEMLKGF